MVLESFHSPFCGIFRCMCCGTSWLCISESSKHFLSSSDTSLSMMWSFGVNPRFLKFSWILLYHLGCRSLFCSLVMWLEYCSHHSGRPPIYNCYLCLIALENFQLGQIFFQLDQIAGGVLHLCSPLS